MDISPPTQAEKEIPAATLCPEDWNWLISLWRANRCYAQISHPILSSPSPATHSATHKKKNICRLVPLQKQCKPVSRDLKQPFYGCLFVEANYWHCRMLYCVIHTDSAFHCSFKLTLNRIIAPCSTCIGPACWFRKGFLFSKSLVNEKCQNTCIKHFCFIW